MGQILFSFFLRERGEHPGVGTQRLTTKWEKNKQTKTGNKKRSSNFFFKTTKKSVFAIFFFFLAFGTGGSFSLCVTHFFLKTKSSHQSNRDDRGKKITREKTF